MVKKDFQTEYAKLNTAQKQAVDTIEGPVMVIAGPGTGKTTILTLRIAQILKQTDTDPRSILALTFTESAVSAMRDKLKMIIGGDAYKVRIHTFHGFCNEIINRHPEYFPRIIGSTPATEVDKVRIIERAIEDTEFLHIKPYGDTFYFVRSILHFIQEIKRDDIAPANLEVLLDEDRKRFEATPEKIHTKGKYKDKMKGEYVTWKKYIDKMDEVVLVYRAYEERIKEERLFDFEDMLLEVVRAFEKDEPFKLSIQEQFLYILADEHQDANQAQNSILENLSDFHKEPNLFIVGDEKQAIFRFQGASLENFLYFKKTFPSAVSISLTINYRSTQSILDGAHSLITSNATELSEETKALRIALVAGGQEVGVPLFVHTYSHTDLEYQGTTDEIHTALENGILAQSIAVIYRNNAHAFAMAEALDARSIPYVIESRQNILADSDIQKLLLFFRALNGTGDNILLGRTLFLDFLGLPLTDVSQVLLHYKKTQLPLIKILTNKEYLLKAGVDQVEEIMHAGERFLEWARYAKNKGILEAFEYLVKESGFLQMILAHSDSAEKLHLTGELFDEARRAGERYQFFTLDGFLDHLAFIEKYAIPITTTGAYVPPHAVRLMTAHRSKGLEFKQVYIIDALESVWGDHRNTATLHLPGGRESELSDGALLDDERRLFYVALTRAEEKVTISYSERDSEGRVLSRSQFIDEIPETLREEKDMRTEELGVLATAREGRFLRKGRKGLSLKDEEYLRSRFLEQGLSVTALNNYLSCPWQYFFRNLVRLPEASTFPLRYGTAVHDALRHLLDTYREKNTLELPALMDRFNETIARLSYSDSEYARLREKGEQALPGFFEHRKDTFPKNSFTEYDIHDVFFEIAPEIRILLRGKLDVVIPYENDTVHIIDFKTGAPKSRNAIEGKTKNDTGDYKRQLVFYKLLYDAHTKGRERMVTGEIVFTEPNKSGTYKEEVFEIEPEEVEELEVVLKRVGEEIYSLSFWDSVCGTKNCEYCAVRGFLEKK